MKVLFSKLIVVAISLATRFFFGLLPLLVFKTVTENISGGAQGNKRVKYWISVLMFFGGGVLLATSFVHMMPDVREMFVSQGLDSVVPVPEIIFITGFFLVYFLEEVVHGIIHYRHQKEKKSESMSEVEHEGHSHLPLGIQDEEESMAGALRNLLIVVAISFHGVFEGLAIGLQETTSDVWQLFLAVSVHECTILFCIGVELIASQTKLCRMITYISVVSVVSPLGISIGMGVSQNSEGRARSPDSLLVATLQGIAAGTLLYVAFFEIFAIEGRKLQKKYEHIIVAVFGFFLMVCFQVFCAEPPDSDGARSNSRGINGTNGTRIPFYNHQNGSLLGS